MRSKKKRVKIEDPRHTNDFINQRNYTHFIITKYFNRREDLEVKLDGNTLLYYFEPKTPYNSKIYIFTDKGRYMYLNGRIESENIMKKDKREW